MFFVTAGATNQTIDIFLQDSSSATGGGLTGLTNASSGLTCYFRKGATGTVTQLTLASQTVGGAHTDGGFVELDSTNAPGTYRLDLSDAMVSAEGTLTIYLHGATNLLQTPIRVHVASATRGYTGTALPAAAADAAGGLVIFDAGGLDVDTYLGRITGNVALASSLPSNFSLLGINGSGHVSRVTLTDTTTTNTDMRGTDSAFLAASAPSNFSSLGINASGHVSRVTLVDTTTTNTDMVAAAPTAASVADAVWDEALSGHTVAGSTGKAIKQLKEGVVSVDGSVDDSSATTTTFVSNLTETTDGFYHDKVIVFISGDLAGQARHIETYTGSTKSITVSQGFTSAPADGDEFLILATHEHSINEIQSGLATAASIAALNDLSSADVTAAVPTAAQIRTEIDSNSTQLALLVDGQGYQLTILAGAISNAGTATEAFTFTYNSTDYAATYAGLDTSGNRGTTVLSKP
ncbi:MAG TPA: hypothetical protein DCG12_02100 [Planctomycetaceae bacterium]|nr:hypothetical protein [Planctomycetaceae bacterium]